MVTYPARLVGAAGRMTEAVRSGHRPMWWWVVLNVAIGAVAIVGLIVDDRIVLGAPAWLKPLKFAISFALYGATLSWMHGQLTRFRRTAWWAGTIIATTLTIEMVLIVMQVARGVGSHFNTETAFDRTVGRLMVLTIIVFWVVSVVLAVALIRQRVSELASEPDNTGEGGRGSRADDHALRLGFVLTVIGTALGALMAVPAVVGQTGDPTLLGVRGGHSVGVPDGGPGLPLTAWSTEGGDLRIPHFIGLHALQVVLLVAVLLRNRVSELARVRLVWITGGGFLGLVVLTLWQALRAQPLLRPDSLTLAAAGLLVGSVAAAVVATVAVDASDRAVAVR